MAIQVEIDFLLHLNLCAFWFFDIDFGIDFQLLYSFTINFQTGPRTSPRDDSALHLSVRPVESVIVRNHHENNVWGTEERFGGCPIYPGQPFEMLILAESTGYKVCHIERFYI